MRKAICLLSFIFLAGTIRLSAADLFKWGKVDEEILCQKSYPMDTSAAAIVLFDIGEMEIDRGTFTITTRRHCRMQVFKESGKEYADVRIALWHEDAISNVRAQTILPNGDKIKLKKSQIFEEKKKKEYNVTVFSIPGVENPCVFEYSYEITSKYISRLDPWQFQWDIPTILSRISILIPRGFSYNSYLDNCPVRGYQPISDKILGPNGNNRIQYTWEFTNLDAIKDEPYMTTIDDYLARLRFQLDSYKDDYNAITFISTWDDLVKKISWAYDPYLKPGNSIEELYEEIVGQETGRMQQIEKLYRYVRDSVETGEYNGIYGENIEVPGKVMKNRSGSRADKNLLLIGLLRAGKFDADPLLISTRSHGKVNTESPLLDSFNSLVVRLQFGKTTLLFDASNKYCPFRMMPYSDYNGKGLHLSRDGAKIVDVPKPTAASSGIAQSDVVMNADGSLKVKTVIRLEGYQNISARFAYEDHKKAKEFVEEEILNEIKNISIDTCEILNLNQKELPLTINVEYTVDNFAEVTDERIYFTPLACQAMTENRFKLEKRTYPIEYPYPYVDQEEVIYHFPEGYIIEERPSPKRIVLTGQEFSRITKDDAKGFSYSRLHGVHTITYTPDWYSDIKNLYSEIVKADKEQIVLKKVNQSGSK